MSKDNKRSVKEYRYGVNSFFIFFMIIFFSLSIFFIINNFIHEGFETKRIGNYFLAAIAIVASAWILILLGALLCKVFNINQKIIISEDNLTIPKTPFILLKPTIVLLEDIISCDFKVAQINYTTRGEVYLKTINKTYYFNDTYFDRETAKLFVEDINKIISEMKK